MRDAEVVVLALFAWLLIMVGVVTIVAAALGLVALGVLVGVASIAAGAFAAWELRG